MPLFDATDDFDGAVIEMDIDRNHWTSQNGGWFDMTVEIALQAPGYTDGTWLPAQPGVTGDGGWFEACYNGYVDVYIVPEGSWNVWYREAQYGYVYGSNEFPISTGGSGVETGSTTSNTWIIGPDGDTFPNEDEYWYRNDGRVASSQGFFSTDGKRSTYVFPHDQTTYSTNPSNSQTVRATSNGGGYYGLLPELGYTTSAGDDRFIRNENAQMKLNQWHSFLNEDGVVIYDDDVEDGGGLWNKPGASGGSDALPGPSAQPSRGAGRPADAHARTGPPVGCAGASPFGR